MSERDSKQMVYIPGIAEAIFKAVERPEGAASSGASAVAPSVRESVTEKVTTEIGALVESLEAISKRLDRLEDR